MRPTSSKHLYGGEIDGPILLQNLYRHAIMAPIFTQVSIESAKGDFLFTTLHIKRLSADTVFKLISIGFACSFVPLMVILGLFAAFEAETVKVNGEYVTGLGALLLATFSGLFATVFFAFFFSLMCALGLWIYSWFHPMSITVKSVQELGKNSAE
jgi:hypothetical protein